jgi:hypothetical protein
VRAALARQVCVPHGFRRHLSAAFGKLGCLRSRNEATALILDPASGFGTGILRITDDPVITAS